MYFINNLKTKTKLLLSFAIILIITAGIGVNGLMYASQIQNNLNRFYEDFFVSNLRLGKMQVNQEKASQEMLTILWMAAALEDPSAVKSSEEDLEKIVEENDQLLEEYEKTCDLPEEITLLAKLKTINSDYRIARQEIIDLVKAGNFDLAVQLNEQKAKPMQEETSNILAQMKELNDKTASNLIAASQTDFAQTRSTAVIMLGIAILAGIGFSILLGNAIATPVKAVVEYARFMANGDFTKEVPQRFLRRRDEMGELFRDFAEMNLKIRALLKEVTSTAAKTSAASQELSSTVEEVSAQGENINATVEQIAFGIEETSAAVEEITSSSTEIKNGAEQLKKRRRKVKQKLWKLKKELKR